MGYYDTDYLEHHGILGQKWGVRRFQNADGSLTSAGKKHYGAESTEKIDSRKGTQRRLNDLDKAMAFHKRTMNEAETQSRKAVKTLQKHDTSTKQGQKAVSKLKTSTTEITEAMKNIKAGQAEIDKIMSDASKRGLSINSKECLRSVNKGKDYLKTVLASAAISAVTVPTTGWAIAGIPGNYVKGTKYKVKEKAISDPEVEEYKKVYSDWDNAYSKYYNNTDKSKSASLKKMEEKTSEKEKAMYEKLKTKYSEKEIENMWSDALKNKPEKSISDNKVSKWNDSKSYNKDFLNYLKKEGSKPEDIDDYEYLDLIKMEYEENTGKKAMKE